MKSAVTQALDEDDLAGLQVILDIDPLTTARYLRVANSPLFGRRHNVASAAEAMDLLGRRAAAMIALVASFDYGFCWRRRDGRLESARRHSLQTAVLAQQLAHCGGAMALADGLFVAGLLHDIAGMLRPMDDESGFDSAVSSAELLAAWHLPHMIVDAIADTGRAHATRQAPTSEAGRLLWVAHQFAPLLADDSHISIPDIQALAGLLDADSAAVHDALQMARLRYASFERCLQ